MKMRKLILILILSSPVAAQHPWDGIIDPSRAVDWTKAGIPGGIPNVTNLCTVAAYSFPIQPSNDTTGATDGVTINNALRDCGATATAANPVVVTLAAGNFYTNNGITFGDPSHNYTVLRGAGPDKTIISSPGDVVIGCGIFSYMCIMGSNSNNFGSTLGNHQWLGTNNQTGVYTKGATILNLDSTTGMVASPFGATNIGAASTIINLDQRTDAVGVCPALVTGAGTGQCAGVNGVTESGNTVTMHVSLPLSQAFQGGLNVGDCIGVGGVGETWRVTGESFAANGSGPNGTGGIVTLTVTPNPNGPGHLPVGSYTPGFGNVVVWGGQSSVIVLGMVPSGFNGTLNLTQVTATSVSFQLNADPGPVTTYGTVNSLYGNYSSDFNQSLSCTDAAGTWRGYYPVKQILSANSFTFDVVNSGLDNGGSNRSGATNSYDGYVAKDTGGVFMNAVVGPFTNEGGNNGRNCPDIINNPSTCAAGEIARRDYIETKRVVDICVSGAWQNAGGSCQANSIMIDPPVELPMWRTSQTPGVFWWGTYAVRDGIEGLTLDMSLGKYDSSRFGISLQNAYQSWVRNVRTINGNRAHIRTSFGLQLMIRDNYFYGVKGNATQSYGIEEWGSSNLMENNICQHIISCQMVAFDWGGVYGYNFATDCPWGAASLSTQNCAQINHDFSAMMLEEGDNMSQVQADNIHGMAYALTSFRNRYRIQDSPWKYNNLGGHYSSAFNRALNVIDNVLGTRKNEMQYYDKRQTYDGMTIFNTGYQGENFQVPPDWRVRPLLLRWGNYDVCSDSADTTTPRTGNDPSPINCTSAAGANGIRFCGNSSSTGFATTCGGVSEIPTAGGTFIGPNAIPTVGDTTAGQAGFPASFYLSGPPDFWTTTWGTPGWPAIGADVNASGPLDTTCANPPQIGFSDPACDGVRHHSYMTPAQICWLNTAIDPNGTGAGGYPQQTYPITGQITVVNASGYFQYTIPLPTGHVIPQCSSTPFSSNDCMPVITVTGAQPAEYNGTYQGALINATGFTFVRPNTFTQLPAHVAGTGQVNWPNVHVFNAASCYPNAYSATPQTPLAKTVRGNGKITGNGQIK